MDTIQIVITGCRKAPRWETLQLLLSESVDDTAKITRIHRADNGVDYQAIGVYDLTLRVGRKPDTKTIPITLTITGENDENGRSQVGQNAEAGSMRGLPPQAR